MSGEGNSIDVSLDSKPSILEDQKEIEEKPADSMSPAKQNQRIKLLKKKVNRRSQNSQQSLSNDLTEKTEVLFSKKTKKAQKLEPLTLGGMSKLHEIQENEGGEEDEERDLSEESSLEEYEIAHTDRDQPTATEIPLLRKKTTLGRQVSFIEGSLKRQLTKNDDGADSKRSLRKSSTRQAGSSNENSIKEPSNSKETSG